MKKLWIVVLGLLLIGCKQPVANDLNQVEEEASYRRINAQEAFNMMTEDVIILDVRTKEEYLEGHIANSLLLPVDDILAGKLDMLMDKGQVILVYCRSGNRSRTAAMALVEAGYSQVYDFGGIRDWPYDIVE